MKTRKIGIVGCGAIGTAIAKAIVKNFSRAARLCALYDTDAQRARNLSGELHKRNITAGSLAELVRKCDFVVEAASAGASAAIAGKAIAQGRDCMVMSVGGLLKSPYLFALARKKRCSLYIPSGAIGGIDCVKAHRLADIKKVTLTTYKPARALQGAPYVVKNKINLEHIQREKQIFQGSAEEAVLAFPQNINVAATLSLAGVGSKKTMVKIVCAPKYSTNVHEIEIESAAGKTFVRCENNPCPDNARTSYLAVLSACATLTQVFEPVKIGT